MKHFFAFLLFFGTLIFSTPSHALIELGALAGYRTDTLLTENTTTYTSGSGYQLGGIVHFSIIPQLQFRTGIILRNSSVKTSSSGYNYTFTNKTTDIPLQLRFTVPMTGLYASGGVTYSMTQSTTCEVESGGTCSVANSNYPNDLIVNLGAGYEFLDLAVFKLLGEAQYDMGTKNLITTGGASAYERGWQINVIALFSL